MSDEENDIKIEDLDIDPEDIICDDSFPFFYENDYDKFGFNLKLLKRNELNVNLIHFDLKMTNKENYKYYNNFKIDVVGEYFAIDNLEFLKKFLEVMKDEKIPFIVLSSGSSGKDVIKICKEYSFVKEIIIFCGNYKYNKHYIKEYKGYVKKVLTSINEVYEYIKSNKLEIKEIIKFNRLDPFNFSYEDIKMNKQLEQIPAISALEYDNCYFLIHRVYAHYFGKMDNKVNALSEIWKFGDYLDFFSEIERKLNKILIKRIEKLIGIENFAEIAIREYTSEIGFCYVFNLKMRKFKGELFPLSYFMGPFLFSVNKYVNDNHEKFGFNEDMSLYKNVQCFIYDFYFYKMNLNHIICFPSITLTYTVREKFIPIDQNKSSKRKKYKDLINLTMIFNYKHNSKNKSPGIIIKDNKASDGLYMSANPNENQVILFPFTFARITKINYISEKEKIYEIYLEIINRKEYIEYSLKDNVDKRFRFSNLD